MEGPKTRRGGHIFQIQYWTYAATGGPNVKWGPGHHWPPRWRRPWQYLRTGLSTKRFCHSAKPAPFIPGRKHLTALDDKTIAWLLNTCPEIKTTGSNDDDDDQTVNFDTCTHLFVQDRSKRKKIHDTLKNSPFCRLRASCMFPEKKCMIDKTFKAMQYEHHMTARSCIFSGIASPCLSRQQLLDAINFLVHSTRH